MTNRAERKYLEQFEVVPYAVKIDETAFESAGFMRVKLQIVLQSKSWSKEDTSRVQIDSAALRPKASFSVTVPSENGVCIGSTLPEIESEINLVGEGTEISFDREVTVYEFEIVVTGSLVTLMNEVSYEQKMVCLKQLLLSSMLSVTYGVIDSEAKAEEEFQGVYSSSDISWRRVREG